MTTDPPLPGALDVRSGRLEDVPFLVRANLAMARETEDLELDPETLDAGVRGVFAEPSRGRYFVAERAGTPAGCLMVTLEWSDWRNGAIWWIQSVYVVPEQRGAGIYRALHEAVLAEALRDGARGVRLYVDRGNTAAQQVYLRLGMRRSHYDLFEQDPRSR